jgi:hypothetical protein
MSSSNHTESIEKELTAIEGVMRDDIVVNDDTVTTYVPTDQLEDAKSLREVDVEVLEEHEYEYLISATLSS